jgi:hypothetical protein
MSGETVATCPCTPCSRKRARKRSRVAKENDQYGDFVRDALTAYGRRIGQGDIEELPRLVSLAEELEPIVVAAIAELRSARWGYSWSEIGRVLATTKQAAQQRYGPKIDSDGRSHDEDR